MIQLRITIYLTTIHRGVTRRKMVTRILKTLTALVLCVYTAAAASPPTPIVNLGYATYEGILVQDAQTNQTNINFLGVRYAASPTGATLAIYRSTFLS